VGVIETGRGNVVIGDGETAQGEEELFPLSPEIKGPEIHTADKKSQGGHDDNRKGNERQGNLHPAE
jgi:hypothetical protein